MVGILTFHRAVNYGAVLQTYALQNTLQELNIPNEIIDYRAPFIEQHYSPKPSVSPVHLRHYLKELWKSPMKRARRKEFEHFVETHLQTSIPVLPAELPEISSRYQAVITGSDQVWNLAVSGEDTAYALDWVSDSVRRVSYAASIGPDTIKPEYGKLLSPWLKKYDFLSVREPSAIPAVEQISGKKAFSDVDPTVLPSREFWEKAAAESSLHFNKYIFVYIMQPSEVLYDVAQNLADRYGLQIYTISMVPNSRHLGQDIPAAGVEDFLWLIQNAEYVVTNSFHGMMLSLRFHKEFYWAFQQGTHMSNPRFTMLSEQYGIGCRCCTVAAVVDKCTELDYSYVEDVMACQRVQAKANILKSLQGVSNEISK